PLCPRLLPYTTLFRSRHMVESGDWLFPHRGHELYSDKPPLFMWLQAAAYELVGSWRVAFLLPSLLAALGTLWCVQDLGRRLWNRSEEHTSELQSRENL